MRTTRPSLRALWLHLTNKSRIRIWDSAKAPAKLLIRISALFRRRYLDFIGMPNFHTGHDRIGYSIARVLHRSDRWEKLLAGMKEAGDLGAQGLYRQAVVIRREILEESYHLLGLDPASHFPQSLAPSYATNIGHLALAGTIAHANSKGLVPQFKRFMPIRQVGNLQVVEALSQSFEQVTLPMNSNSLTSLSASFTDYDTEPSLWPLFERLNTIRSSLGLQDLYQFLEHLGMHFPVTREDTPFVLPSSYREWGLAQLGRFGINEGDPVVTLHVRELPDQVIDHRSAGLETYVQAVDHILKAGFKVVRFGSSWMSPLPEREGLLDLVTYFKGDNRLDLLAISMSTFMITTVSGPAFLANSMGVPTLTTNTTAIGRNALSSLPCNRYLPKRFKAVTGRVMSLSETLGSPLAYWEGVRSRHLAEVPQTIGSSATEILEASKEMIDLVTGQSDPYSQFHRESRKIRELSGAVAFGSFSGSFLSKNEDWLK